MNPFTYCELHTPDAEQAKSFYRALFDWKLADHQTPMGTYTEIVPGDGPMGGLMTVKDAPTGWVVYVRVDDLRASTQKARELGAKVLADHVEIAGQGHFSLIVDPTGAQLGLWQPKAS